MKQTLLIITGTAIISMGCLTAAGAAYSMKVYDEAVGLIKEHQQLQTRMAQMRTPGSATRPDKKYARGQ